MRTLCAVNAKSVKKLSHECSACRDNSWDNFYHNFEQIFPIFLLKMRTLCAVNFKQKTGFYYRLFPVKTCSNFEQDFIKKMMTFCAKNLFKIYVNLGVKLLPFFSVFFTTFLLKMRTLCAVNFKQKLVPFCLNFLCKFGMIFSDIFNENFIKNAVVLTCDFH